MTVEELIEELRAMPATATVEVQVRTETSFDGIRKPLYEFRGEPIDSVLYDRGTVSIRLDE